MLDNIVLQAEEGNTGTKGDGGCGGGRGHQPHHGAPLQRGEQPRSWGARGRWGAGCRKARLPEAKAQDASGDQASQIKHFKPCKIPKNFIRAFTKESLEKINLRTANLIRDYGYLPKVINYLSLHCVCWLFVKIIDFYLSCIGSENPNPRIGLSVRVSVTKRPQRLKHYPRANKRSISLSSLSG